MSIVQKFIKKSIFVMAIQYHKHVDWKTPYFNNYK